MRILRATPLGLLALVTLAGVVVLAGADRATASSFSSTSRHALPGSSPGVPAAASATGFLDTFDNDPSSPTSFYNASPSWDVSIQSRFDKGLVMQMDQAAHGPDCAPSPATHSNNHYTGVAYQCKNHVMTSVATGGYAAVYLTPNQMVDFSQGEAIIRFDQSTLITSNRDWVDLWITPFGENLQFPLPTWQQFLAGDPRNSVHVDGTKVTVIRDFQRTDLSTRWWKGITEVLGKAGLEPSPKRRDTFEVRISRDHISWCITSANNFCWADTPIDPPLTWDRGIVQFGHHSYNPTKGTVPSGHDCSLAGSTQCPGPNTWHRDNVEISPAVPFAITNSDRRYVDSNTTDTVNFEAPAPANAFLRFMIMRQDVGTEISLDGGQTWVGAQHQLSGKVDVPANVWHPIPEGTASVQVRAAPGNRGDWFAFDFRFWSSNTDGAVLSVPSPPPTVASAGVPTALPATGSEPRAGSSFPWTIAVALVAGCVTLLAGGAAVLRRTR
jgi:hypothetical protein